MLAIQVPGALSVCLCGEHRRRWGNGRRNPTVVKGGEQTRRQALQRSREACATVHLLSQQQLHPGAAILFHSQAGALGSMLGKDIILCDRDTEGYWMLSTWKGV